MTSMNLDMSKHFNKFAGREVSVTENPQELTIGGKTYKFLSPQIAAKDPATAELRAEAKKMGLSLREWLPESAGTCDFDTSRLNIDIEKHEDGKYRIGNRFMLG